MARILADIGRFNGGDMAYETFGLSADTAYDWRPRTARASCGDEWHVTELRAQSYCAGLRWSGTGGVWPG